MKVQVTQEDLDAGLSRSYTHDALCRAIKRAVEKKYKTTHSFQVLIPNRDYAFIDGGIVELPPEAAKLIWLIDTKQPTVPTTFIIEDFPSDFFTADHGCKR